MEDDHDTNKDEAAKGKFRDVLLRIRLQPAQTLNTLIEQGVVRLMAGDTVRGLHKGKVAFCACFDPRDNSAKAIVALDSDRFTTRRPLSLEGSVRDMLKKFEGMYKFADKEGLSWQPLGDSEIETFIREASSARGSDYRVLNL